MTITSKIKNVGVLLRISREAGEGRDTLQSHRTIAERYCKERGYIYKFYEEVISGAKNIEERKALNNLLQDVQLGLYEAIFVISTDRISRDSYYLQYVAKILSDHDILIITPEKIYDLNGDDRFMFDMMGAVSSQELRLINKRQKRGKREGSLRGEWVQGIPPFGYVRSHKTKKLIIEEKEAKVVRMIFDYALAGYGMAAIVGMLAGYRTRSYEVKGGKNAGTIHTGKPFGISQVDSILKNPVYKGTILYQVKNKQKQVIDPIVKHDAHEGIVTPDEFQQVQFAVKSRISGGSDGLAKRTRSKGQVISILKDLVYCHCGRKMQFKKDSKQKDTVYLKGCQCSNKGIAEHKLLLKFWDELSIIERYLRMEWDKILSNADTTINIEDLRNQIDTLRLRKDKLTKKSKHIRNSYHEEEITRDEYLEDKAEVEKDLTEVSTTIQELEERIELSNKETLSKRYETKLKWLKDVRKLADRWEGKTFLTIDKFDTPAPLVTKEDIAEVNRMLKLVIEKVTYRRFTFTEVIGEDNEGNAEIEESDVIELEIIPR